MRRRSAGGAREMGWIKELNPKLGLEVLARRLVSDPRWGERGKNPRAVANQLRSLDGRGHQGVTWLRNRPAVQEVLADALGVSPDELLGYLAAEPDRPADPMLRLDELPRARPVDLRREPMFPGVPRGVLEGGWRRTWWVAPGGSGRSVAGLWLEARGRASYLRGRDWGEVVARLPAAGAVYLELEAGGAPPAGEVPEGLSICIATPLPPAPGWDVVEEPEPGWEIAFLRWVAERLPPGGGFELGAAERQLAQMGGRVVFPTPGDLFAFCALLDHFGAARMETRDVGELALRYLELRAARADRAGGLSVDALWAQLVGLAERLLRHAERPPLPPEVWASFVPAAARPPDPEALRRLIDAPSSEADLRARLRALVRPGPEGTVSELVHIGLLESAGAGGLRPRPGWLWAYATMKACSGLVEEPERGLGEALAVGREPGLLLRRVVLRGRSTPGELAGAVLPDARDPAGVALVEAALHGEGLGRCPWLLDVPAPDRGWDERARALRAAWWRGPEVVPLPRGLVLEGPGAEQGPGAWVLAWLAVTRVEPAEGAWDDEPVAAAALRALDAELEQARRARTMLRDVEPGLAAAVGAPEWTRAAPFVAAELAARHPALADLPLEVLRPLQVARAAQGRGEWPNLAGFPRDTAEWTAAGLLARLEGTGGMRGHVAGRRARAAFTALATLPARLWRRLGDVPAEGEHLLHATEEPVRKAMWGALPAGAVARVVGHYGARVPWRWLSPPAWAAVETLLSVSPAPPPWLEDALRELPAPRAPRVLETCHARGWPVSALLWERLPAVAMASAVRAAFAGAPFPVPPDELGTLLAAIRARLAAGETPTPGLRAVLSDHVRARARGWPEVWGVLVEVDHQDAVQK